MFNHYLHEFNDGNSASDVDKWAITITVVASTEAGRFRGSDAEKSIAFQAYLASFEVMVTICRLPVVGQNRRQLLTSYGESLLLGSNQCIGSSTYLCCNP